MHRDMKLFRSILETAGPPTVFFFTGMPTNENISELIDAAVDGANGFLGMKVMFEPTAEQVGRYTVSGHELEDQLIVFRSDDDGYSGVELVINGNIRLNHGTYFVDGFFLVTFDGVHEGTASFTLLEVDEAIVRTNKMLRVLYRPLSRNRER